MRLTPAECRRRLAGARHAILATVTPDGRPHVVPVVFVLGGDRIFTAVDTKPKSTPELQRVRNVRAQPRAAVLAEHYHEDWARLWWVRADGDAEVVDGPVQAVRAGASLLARRYPQYRGVPPPGPLIVVRVTAWSGWSAA